MKKAENNKTKYFLSINEQVDRLENDWKLIIKNKKQLKHYLETYNYEFFINEYSKFLLRINDINRKFMKKISDETLIAIFKFEFKS